MQHCSICLSRLLWFALVAALVCHGACISGAYGLPTSVAAYPGEYVITLPAQSVRRSEDFIDQASVQALSLFADSATTIRRLGPRTSLISTNRQSSSRGLRIERQAPRLQEPQLDDRFCKDLLASGEVESCTPNYQLSTQQISAPDPRMSELWGLSDDAGIAAPRAWEITTGSPDIVVAVIDTGVDYNHPDLAANIWVNPGEIPENRLDDDGNGYVDDIHGVNTSIWATNRVDPFDDNQHGTHVAGTIGASHGNGIGVGGVSPSVTILPIKFMDSSGSGRLSDAIAAIDYMVDLKVNRGVDIRVANNSWGGGAYSPALREAIERARDAGIVFVVAAGNSGEDIDLFPAYPASYEVSNVLSVAAIDRNQNLAAFSNYGAEAVDIAAPGAEIVSTLPTGQYGALSGTSMATPHVVGSLALLFAREPALSVEDAIARMLGSGRELPALQGADGTASLVKSRRGVDVSKMVRNETAPIPSHDGGLPVCGYTFETTKVNDVMGLDMAADQQEVVNQVDEGDYYRVELPFDFPFFRTTTRTLFISPNGLVYLNQPKNPDYQVAPRAPNNSIAAFHTDLIPRKANQGVRVFSDSERATVFWSSEHYSLAEQGPVAVRLTLYRNGLVHSTISFESMQEPVLAARTLLGDPFATTPTLPLGLIGISTTSARASSVLDIAAAQRALLTGPDQRLDLRVAMIPNCFTMPEVETRLVSPQIENIKLALSESRKRIAVTFLGKGSGNVMVTGIVNGKQCLQEGQASLVDGLARARLSVPRGVNKVTLRAQTAHKTISFRGQGTRSTRNAHAKHCVRVMRSLQ